ncbi:MAG: UDP-N-acetylmuramate dehydrogenase [Elusimicrobiota bacterium]
MNVYSIIKEKFKDDAVLNLNAKEITSYKTGGKIEVVVYPRNVEDLVWLFEFIKKENINYFICGNCSNILLSDEGFKGVFIKTDKFKNIFKNKNKIFVSCGYDWDRFIEFSVLNSLKGLEKTSYIPGTVGGAVRMNAGAFGEETFDRLINVLVLDIQKGAVKRIEKKEIKYGYRRVDNFENYFIIEAGFEFEYGNKENLFEIRNDVIKRRKEKQPLEYPSAGSVFKRPEGNYASKLIDDCGLKGFRIGGAMVSTKHAGFIINYDNATSTDIYSLIMKVREEVYKKTGIKLELEQIIVGEFN